MDQLLPFFPRSLPDETLCTRISRYHLLSGNRTDAITLKELFGRPAGLGTVVSAFVLQSLAARLLSEPKEMIARLVDENTLLPAFAPFLGIEAGWPVAHDLDLRERYRRLGHIPQRVNGFVESWRLCVDCLRDDIQEYGIGNLKKMAEHGFTRKSMVSSHHGLRQALLSEFDLDFLRYVDPSIDEPNRRNWFRLTLVKGQSEMPLTRHILSAMYLFGDFKSFSAEAVNTVHRLPTRRQPSKNASELAEARAPKLKAMRHRVRLLQAQQPDLALEKPYGRSPIAPRHGSTTMTAPGYWTYLPAPQQTRPS